MQIYVFDRSLNFTGAIDNYSSLRWRRRFNQFSEFELHCPLNPDTLSPLIRGSIICKSDSTEEAGFIEYRELQQNEQGEEFLVIKGKFLKSYLSRRIIWAQELLNTTNEIAMRTLVNDQCITPTDPNRIMPNLQLGALKNYVGDVNYQVTYNNLFDELINLTNLSNLGFRILLDTINKKLNFDVYQGMDRTAGQAINPRCIFSMDFDNILSQNYIDSSNNLKNVALVGGTGVDSARKLVAVGSSAGLDRFEMFVDANNLSNINSVDSSVITDDIYLPMLTAKGTADLALTSDIKTFDSKVNTNSNLTYKTDYDLGDKVTCLNKKWGLTMDTVIVEIEEIYEAQGTKINVVFGNNIPTLADKIKIISNQQQGGVSQGDSPAFMGIPTAPTAAVNTDTNQLATTAFVKDQVPAGQVSHFAMASAPSGWLKADGALVSRATYAALYAAIGIVFGAGDGLTTFNLPDMRGSFVRGLDNGKGLDTGRVLGSYQVDAFKSHGHPLDIYIDHTGAGTNQGILAPMSVQNVATPYNAQTNGDIETRPKNIALLACIKY